jgi:voltage-gated potassium channel
MTLQIILSLLIITATICIHGVGTAWWIRYLLGKHQRAGASYGFARSMTILSLTAVFLMLLHYIEISIWALTFLMIPELDKLSSWEEAIYFSTVTYTTLGYGDITLPLVWRVMSGFEAMNGILLFGWSTAMFYAVVQKIVLMTGPYNEMKRK